MDSPLKVGVVGAGGVGGLIGAVLARSGHRVTFVASAATSRLLNEHGISVRSSALGDFHVEAPATEELHTPVDLCVIAVKAPALRDALRRVDPMTVGDGLVLPLLNGVEHLAEIVTAFGRQRSAAGAVRVSSARVSPGVIEHYTPFLDIQAAAVDGRLPTDVLEGLRGSGITVSTHTNPAHVLWNKLVFLAPFALATAAHDSAIGVVRTRFRSDLATLAEETTTVGAAHGADQDVQQVLEFVDQLPETMRSSLQRDIAAGVDDELDALGGAVLRAAAALGLPAPMTAEYVHSVAARRRGAQDLP